ncbi:Hypothetical protein, putative, partial [Bodo saltans]
MLRSWLVRWLLRSKCLLSTECREMHHNCSAIGFTDLVDLIALCEQARCGVDGKTVTDLSVRKTLRVAADRVSVEWPALSAAAEDLGRGAPWARRWRGGGAARRAGVPARGLLQAARGLDQAPAAPARRAGVPARGLLQAARGLDQAPAARATLVLDTGLAMERSVGGVLHVGDAPWVSCGAGSYAAWHTNAEHHVTELVSGHRVVAMYNLLQSEPVLQTADRFVDEAEVAVLVEHLKRNAATYVRRFSKEEIATLTIFSPRTEESSQRRDPAEWSAPHRPWSARHKQSWNCYKDHREFIGFWLMRQYVSDAGVVRCANLNGADADLRAAVAQEFGVPLAHIECRVVCHYGHGEERLYDEIEESDDDAVSEVGRDDGVYADYECPEGSVYVGECRSSE